MSTANVHALSFVPCKEAVYDVLRAGLVPMVTASPGVGKSALAAEIAKERNLLLIDLRLSQSDPTDLNGFPFINKSGTKAGYVPMDTFPIEGDSLPWKVEPTFTAGTTEIATTGEKYAGWFLLLDEFNSAPMSVQAAAYKLVLDKQVGMHKLHDKVAIMCAGNLATDNAIVNRTSTAMQSRLIHLELLVKPSEWLDWGYKNGIDYRVLGFIAFRDDLLHKFDANHNDKTFPCSRTWEFVSKIIKPWAKVESKKLPILAGTVGTGAATEFKAFCDVYGEIPTIQEIINNPLGVPIKDDPSVSFALSALVSGHMELTKQDDMDQLIKFTNRLAVEFQVITFQGAIKRDRKIADCPAIDKWLNENYQDLL